MTPEIYSPLALLTAMRFDASGDFTHAALGLASEIQELADVIGDTPKVIDEAGDVCWYLNLAAVSQGLTFGADPDTNLGDCTRLWLFSTAEVVNALRTDISTLADMAKKLMITGRFKRPELLRPTLDRATFAVNLILRRHAGSMEEALAGNIAKLSARYPELRFEAERALNPDKVSEAIATAQVGDFARTQLGQPYTDETFHVAGDLTTNNAVVVNEASAGTFGGSSHE